MRLFTSFVLVFLSTAAASSHGLSDYIISGIEPAQNVDSSSTVSPSPQNGGINPNEPCYKVAQVLTMTNTSIVDSTLALRCLQSVPVDVQGDLLQIEGMKTFAQFQTTLAYLKHPPPGYLYPAVDIIDSLDQMALKLKNNGFSNEFDFQIELSNLIGSAHDGHFIYYPDITQIFTFNNTLSLLSISSDGLTVPQVYLSQDVPILLRGFGTNSSVSPIVKINGQNAESWLRTFADTLSNQDPDANYNSLFDLRLPLRSDTLSLTITYPGPSTSLTFANGTTRTIKTYAFTQENFAGVRDGKTFFKKFCTPQLSQPTKRAKRAPTSTAQPPIPTTPIPFTALKTQSAQVAPPGYPSPVVINDDFSVAGYFPEYDSGVAVLSIPTFQPVDDTQFENVVRVFLATAQAAGKTKLIIDLRGNTGGDVPLAYDLFSQLFPKLTPYGATNFRASPIVHDLGSIVSNYYSNVTNLTATAKDCNNGFSTPPFNYANYLTVDNAKFDSFEEFFGPEQHYGDNYTSQVRFDLDNHYSLYCTNISNHGGLADITPQVFEPENVLIVQDGACASTCAVFSEFMKSQANVKSVVFGGRAQTGPMQGVGGVKGASVYPFQLLGAMFSEAFTNATPDQQQYLNATYGSITDGAEQALARIKVATKASINVRNNIRQGDTSVTPLQFVYEAADCRLFYTAKMVDNQPLVWQAAQSWYWGNGSCVASSTKQPSCAPGVGYINAPPPTTNSTHPVAPPYSNSTTSSAPTTTLASATTGPAPPSPTGTSYTGGAARTSFGTGCLIAFIGLLAAF